MRVSEIPSRRRDLLRIAVLGATGLPLIGTAAASAQSRPPYPPDVGSKFYPNGQVHPFAGSTIVCHLPQQGEHSACFHAMLDVFREAPLRRFVRKVALLPPSSYHMTIFGGATDRSRKADSWPADLSRALPIEKCNDELGKRLETFRSGIALPIRMKIDPEQRAANGRALTFRLRPIDAAEETKLRGLRDRLAEVLKIRGDGHDSYHFHITLGYPIAWFEPSEERDFQQSWKHWAAQIAAKSPEIIFGAPEYCTFEDMFAFHRHFYLR